MQRLHGLTFEEGEARLDLCRGHLRFRLDDGAHIGDEIGPTRQELDDFKALFTLTHEVVRAVGRRDVTCDIGDRSDAMHVRR